MAHHEIEQNLSPEEKLFREHLHSASDFSKIEIYKMARRYYEKALKIKPDDAQTIQMLHDIENLQKKELKTISVIAVVAVVILFAALLF